ncbi:MAG: MFS transporter [Hyphomicrobiales bacterium]
MTGAAVADDPNALARHNTLLLAFAQGVYGCSITVIYVTASIIGMHLAPSRELATLPITALVVGSAIAAIPASMLATRLGRRNAFLVGSAAAMLSSLLCVYALIERSFPLQCVAMMLFGIYQAFSLQYRFAATDLATPDYVPKAVSTVMFGSIAGSVFGPLIVMMTRDLFSPIEFAGCYATTAALALLAAVILSQLRVPQGHAHAEAAARPQAPLGEVLARPAVLLAIVSGVFAYGLMTLLMAGTPVAMVGCGFTADDSAWVIQWHSLAMFLPSFVTGAIIARWGAGRVIAAGVLLFAAAGLVGVSGIAFSNFALGLVALGLAWNFSFIGATSIIAGEGHKRLQAVNDFAIFATVAIASFLSGSLIATHGWAFVNTAAAACAGLWLLVVLALRRHAPKPA